MLFISFSKCSHYLNLFKHCDIRHASVWRNNRRNRYDLDGTNIFASIKSTHKTISTTLPLFVGINVRRKTNHFFKAVENARKFFGRLFVIQMFEGPCGHVYRKSTLPPPDRARYYVGKITERKLRIRHQRFFCAPVHIVFKKLSQRLFLHMVFRITHKHRR